VSWCADTQEPPDQYEVMAMRSTQAPWVPLTAGDDDGHHTPATKGPPRPLMNCPSATLVPSSGCCGTSMPALRERKDVKNAPIAVIWE